MFLMGLVWPVIVTAKPARYLENASTSSMKYGSTSRPEQLPHPLKPTFKARP